MSPLLKLAERVEAAAGPDRELDIEIACALFSETEAAAQGWCHSRIQLRNRLSVCPGFTASLDAALMLGPEGWDYTIDRANGSSAVQLFSDRKLEAAGQAIAKTTALALCAASLRARASGETE